MAAVTSCENALYAPFFIYCSIQNVPVVACLKPENDMNLFIEISNRYGAFEALKARYPLWVKLNLYVYFKQLNNYSCQSLTCKNVGKRKKPSLKPLHSPGPLLLT